MVRKYFLLTFSMILMPIVANAYDTLSFDIDQVYYQDEYRIFDIDFSQGTKDPDTGSLDLYTTWTSKTGSGTNPGMNFHPSDGDGNFFNIDTSSGRYRVSIPKPLDSLPVMTASDSPDWNSVSKYIDEGPDIDYRSGNPSANIEYLKLAFNADRSQMKIYFKVTDESDLSDIGFRFVFFPIKNRGSYGYWSYFEDNYPSGAPKYLIVDLDDITANSGTVTKSKIIDGGVKLSISDGLASCTRMGDILEVTFAISHNDETIIDLSAEEFLMEGVSFSGAGGTPQRQDTFGPRLLYSRAGGEFTVSAGTNFDGQDTSNDYTFSTRLRNFDAFSSDSLNVFTVGMYGNAVPGYNDAPQVSVSGQWVKGFFNGKKYDNSFLFSSRVYDMENSVTGEWLTPDTVEVPNVSPEASVIDIAMKTADNGKVIKLYYRISTDGAEPANIDNIDATWTLFNSFTITSVQSFIGYPVNKGVIFIGSDAIAYPVEMPCWGNEDNNAEIVGTDSQSKSADELVNEFNLTDFQPIAPKEAVELICDPGEKVVLRYLINGFHKELNKLRLYKLKNGNHLKFKDYVESPDPNTITSGDWWITEYGADPDDTLERLGQLKKDERYVLYFVIQDNDSDFDLDDTEGRIIDPTVIGEYSGSAVTFTVAGSVKNVHQPDDSFATYLEVEVLDFNGGVFPDDIDDVVFEGPSGIIASLGDSNVAFEQYDSASGYYSVVVPGQTELGPYTITVTSGTTVRVAIDTQTVIREIPLPDVSSFSPQPGATVRSLTPIFSWDPVSYADVTLYYRLEVRDAMGNSERTPRTMGMTSFAVPPGMLVPGQSYAWRVRVTDSDNWVAVENRSHSDWQSFVMASATDDTDEDGVFDLDDAFPQDAAEWEDTDGDGTGNNADTDDDGDGMPDLWEQQYGLDPLNNDASGDMDADRFSNLREYIRHTDPLDPGSFPSTAMPWLPLLLE